MRRPGSIRVFALCLILFLGLAVPGALAGEKIYWKTATLAPDGVGWARQMKTMVFPEIERVTNGDLEIKVYWGGVMGDEEDVIKKMRIGQLQGAGLAAQGAVMLCPEMSVLELPFLFRNFEEVDYIKHTMSDTFDKVFAKHEFFLLAWVDQDFDQIYSSKFRFNRLSDFKRARFLTWYGELEQQVLTRLGANPVPVNVPEISASMRQGIADSAIGPAIWVVGSQMYTVLKYINPIKIRYSPAVIVVTLDTFKALPEEYQEAYYELRGPLMDRFCKSVRKENEKCLAAMYSYGLQKVDMKPKEVQAIKDRVLPLYEEDAGKLYPKELLEEIEKCLADYRATHKDQ